MFIATVTIDRTLPDIREKDHGTDRLGIRLMRLLGAATSTFEIDLNPAEAIALGERIAHNDLTEATIARMTEVFGGVSLEHWSASQRGAAYLVQTVLSRCPRIVELINRKDGDDSGDLIVSASDEFGISVEFGWPVAQHPCRESVVAV